jgi:hypothetical protein
MGFTIEQKETEIHRDETRVSTKELKGNDISSGNKWGKKEMVKKMQTESPENQSKQ